MSKQLPQAGARSWSYVAMSVAGVVLYAGCQAQMIRSTDRRAYDVIADRQRAAMGTTSDVRIEMPDDLNATNKRMYSFTPRPLDDRLPESFAVPATRGEETPPELGGEEVDELDSGELPSDGEEDPLNAGQMFDLRQSLEYAQRHARDLQNAKEDLYLAALALTLERHLWTPQFSAQLSSEYADFEAEADLDQALTSVAEVAVRQRLPLGGAIAARAVGTFVRDLNDRVTAGEAGQLILDADIPLFRGAGRVAYESRYQAERELIYAVRSYERFRRTFLVVVASAYFDVQNQKQNVRNTQNSYETRYEEWEKAEFIERMGRSDTVTDTSRAQSSLRRAESALVRDQENYDSGLDQFKILIGMSVEESLNVLDQADDVASDSLDDLITDVSLEESIVTALTYRLDLLNDADRVDDTRRGVAIAENSILPDLDFSGQLISNSDPDHFSTTTLSSERTAWRAGLQLRVDDRRTEISEYRAAIVDLRRSQRRYEEFEDQVRAEVRRAVRVIRQAAAIRDIEENNAAENELRLEAARVQFALGKTTNQDVVDAEDELLEARNVLAAAVAAYRVSILAYRRDTGTLRVADDGAWEDPARQPDADGTGP